MGRRGGNPRKSAFFEKNYIFAKQAIFRLHRTVMGLKLQLLWDFYRARVLILYITNGVVSASQSIR